jgi:hypothetical protein
MAILSDTLVPTPNGWVKANQLLVGDWVFNQGGMPQQIKVIQEYTPLQCYRIELDDGLAVEGDGNLKLHLETKHYRDRLGEYQNRKNRQRTKKFTRPLVVKTSEELSEDSLKAYDGRQQYSIQNCQPVRYAARDLPVPPYIFGIWLARITKTGKMWLGSMSLQKLQKRFRQHGYMIVTKKAQNRNQIMEFRPSIRDSFLFADREIPTDLPFYYCDASVEQRLDLLDGLFDGQAIVHQKSRNEYTFKDANYMYVRKVQGLLESLGIKTALHEPMDTNSYVLKFKTLLLSDRDNPKKTYFNRRFVKSVEKIPTKPCIHLESDAQILVGEGFLPIC